MNINKLFNEFIKHCKHEKLLSDKTIKAYKIDFNQFSEYLDSENITQISQVSKNHIRSFVRSISESYKSKTIKRKLATIKSFFNFLEDEDIILANPASKVKTTMKEQFTLPKTLTLTEIQVILESVYKVYASFNKKDTYLAKTSLQNVIIIELLFLTGMRISELTNLRVEDINLDSQVVLINGKNAKQRILYLSSPDVIELLKKHLRQNKKESKDFIFTNRFKNRLSEQSVRNMLKDHSKTLNKNVTPHMFRHTFATLLLEEGVDILYIQKLLGHHSIVVTQIYTYASQAKQKELLINNHPRKKLPISTPNVG